MHVPRICLRRCLGQGEVGDENVKLKSFEPFKAANKIRIDGRQRGRGNRSAWLDRLPRVLS